MSGPANKVALSVAGGLATVSLILATASWAFPGAVFLAVPYALGTLLFAYDVWRSPSDGDREQLEGEMPAGGREFSPADSTQEPTKMRAENQ